MLRIAFLALSFFATNLLFYEFPVKASETVFTTSSDWDAGTNLNLDSSIKEGDVSIGAAGTFGAKSWRTPDLTLSAGTALAFDGEDIYVSRGTGDVLFWKYSPENDKWTTLANLPRGTYYGSELEYMNGYVYAMFGGYQTAFARYSVANDSWEMLSDLPDLIYSGASLENDGTSIYALRSGGTQDFYKYDVGNNSWSPMAGTPATTSSGSDLVRVGNYLYTPRGSNSNLFYRYDMIANTWATMAVLPATINEDVEISTDGNKIYVTRQSGTNSFYAYDIFSNTWSTLANLPAVSRYAGSIYNSNDGYVYVFQGNGTYNFWKYDPTTNTFVGVDDAPAALSTGSDIVYYDDDMYVLRGANSTFYKYDPSANVWTTLTATPGTMTDDVKGVVAGSNLYFFRGGNTNSFYRYSPSGDSWTTMTAPPATVRYGGALSYPGSGDYIYATRGATTRSFWRYSISGDSWDDVVVADLPVDAESSYGSRLISDGTDIFYIPGVGISRFFKYTISNDTWVEITRPPFSPYYGTDLAYYDGKIVALAGWYKKDIYEYNISLDNWRKLQSIPGYYAQDNGVYAGASIEYDSNNSFYISYGNGRQNILTYTPSANKYYATGSWISEIKDLAYVSSFTAFSATSSTPDDSSIIYETRTSSDALSWSDWAVVASGVISSPAQRFIQVKATLVASSGSASSPTLSEISISYAGDTLAPSNPDAISGLSQQVAGITLTSGETYNYIRPYFSWSGATDAQSEVAGYYVYFGSNEVADPESVGFFQTNSNYTVTESLSTGSYYLRIKTKDSYGNISDASTIFTYVYAGISPPQSLTITDFVGTADEINTGNNQLKLASREGGFWLQEPLSNVPATMQYGAKNTAYVASLNKLFAFRGANVATFYGYDLASDTWSTLANAPGNIYIGGGVVEGPDGYLYGLRGNNTSSFYRYDIENNIWSDEDASDAPLAVYYGASMEYDGSGHVYVMRGNNDDAFWRYDAVGDSWESLSNLDFGATTNAVNNSAYVGADLAIDRENSLVYATQGNIRDGFAVYNMNSNSWAVLPDLPQLAYLGSSIEYVSSAEAVYFVPGYYSDKMYKFKTSDQTWEEVSSAPYTFYYGANLKNVGDSLYAIIGGNRTNFYKYSVSKDSWLIPNVGLFGTTYQGTDYVYPGYGEDLVKGDGNYFYLTKGNYSDDFVRYDSSTGSMQKLASTPTGTYSGSSLVYDSTQNKIYLTGGYYLQRFYVYDIASNTWSEEVDDPTLAVTDYGSSMVYDGSRYIYLNRGGVNTTFYRFDTQGSAGSKWSTMTASPAGLGYGAELVFDGNNYIYTLRGQNVANNPFYRYDITSNTWSDPAVSDLNIDVYNDGFATYGGDGNIYAARGENDNDFYKYSVVDNNWTQLGNAPSKIYVGGSGESNGVDKVFMLSGTGTGGYDNGIYTYIMETATSSFEEEGTYTSVSHDLDSVYKWINLQVDYVLANNASLSIKTRSSEDNSTWSSWTAVASEKKNGSSYIYEIKSPAARYLEIKFELSSSDGVYSGAINDYTVNYYKDTSAPSNPQNSGLGAYSNNDPGIAIVSSNWYGYSNPYFDWPDAESADGASDTSTGSGVAGYYVYFGTNSAANPEEDGSLQVDSNYSASNLTDGETYYLRIKTIDDAGNVSAEVWAPFIYKYDSRPPAAPADLSADPSGYSATDSFDFSWSESTSSGAQITEYCYKTAATSGTYAEDQCITDTSIIGIPSHKVGANTFYVRSKDEAGNYSDYASTPYYYVDSGNAPAPPLNLIATPSSNTENSFAFSWDPPAVGTYYGSVANLSYRYKVNLECINGVCEKLSEQNTTPTSLRSLIAGSYANQENNTFYIVTKDEAGNVNYDNYATVTFTATTTAPGIPLSMDIGDNSDKSRSKWKLNISWEVPSIGEVAYYTVYRSVDGEVFTQIATPGPDAITGAGSFTDSGLTQQIYYYKVTACNFASKCGAFSDVVSFFPDGKFIEAAGLVSEPVVSNVTTKKASVAWSTARTADSRISYGTSSGDYFDEEVSNSIQVTNHALNLLNLSPGTTYYYIAKWTDEDGNTGESAEATFVTEPAPTTEEPTVKSMGLDSALIEFISKNAASVRVYFGESSAFGGIEDVVTGSGEGTHTVQLSDLKDGTKYYYKINSFDSEGEEYEGEIHSFETLPRPKIKNIKVSQVKGTARSTLLVTWESNTSISSIVTYYPVTAPGAAKDEVNLALKSGKHQMIIYDLDSQTTYGILIKGKDAVGNEAVGEFQQIATSADSRPPQISDLRVEGEILGVGEESTAQLLVSFNTDEPASAQIEFGEGSGSTYSQKTQEDASLTSHHIVVISGLTPSKVYHLRALSKDQYSNVGESVDKVVITPKATDNALDLVVSNMSLIFGFLGTK
ncbi:hypothetical protein KKI22_04385 [Patescibacteria group bacterium]|nr:hypothetical protein [Patescibacteria group bacterium]